jgi:hypothetical protein
MALPTNDDFANCELSAEELEAIAAGWSLGGIWHSIEHGLHSIVTNRVVAGVALGVVLVGAFVAGGAGRARRISSFEVILHQQGGGECWGRLRGRWGDCHPGPCVKTACPKRDRVDCFPPRNSRTSRSGSFLHLRRESSGALISWAAGTRRAPAHR